MTGLVLTLAPGESFIVNGAVLENGDKTSRIRIQDSNARVLRCRDAMLPQQVDTPAKQIYYGVQLLITGDLEENDVLPAIKRECARLNDVFCDIEPNLIPTLQSMLKRSNFYSALNQLRKVIAIEERLLAGARSKPPYVADQRVA